MKPNQKGKKEVIRRVDPRKLKRTTDEEELASLIERTQVPLPNTEIKNFTELPLSNKTLEGLSQANFVEMTDIQRMALPLALCGRDVLGAAKTGSGKTLAFLIPLVECLYKQKWGKNDGVGALVISPTRELAVQIFQVLVQFGKQHSFSAGLIIGGKDFASEQERISRMNVLVCTPGRLLQHMDQTPHFDCSNLQFLVLDEADRILDLGFSKYLNAIVANLPKERQTLLFSATQTKSVKDLARLSLKEPEYVAVHEKAEHATPAKLAQHYMVCELPAKLDILFSFVKTHLTTKGIVFLSSCKQVRMVHEAFRRLHPGIPLMLLHGKQKQQKRLDIFETFSKTKHAFLFCTDIAARGLDFPAVEWVIQADCPEDAETYIHRVGRTARYESAGQALLFLLPSEQEGMLKLLERKKIPITEIKARASKQRTIQPQLQSFCFQDPEFKYLAQKAFVSYVRSIYLQREKSVFDVHALPAEDFAHAIGLPGAPNIKIMKKDNAKNASRQVEAIKKESAAVAAAAAAAAADGDDGDSDEDEEEETLTKLPAKVVTKVDRMFNKKNNTVLAEHYAKLVRDDAPEGSALAGIGADGEEDDFMVISRRDHALDASIPEVDMTTTASEKAKRAEKKTRKMDIAKGLKGERLVFDDEGEAHPLYELATEADFRADGTAEEQISKRVEEGRRHMDDADLEDRDVAKEKRRAKKLLRKQKDRAAISGTQEDASGGMVVTLGGADSGEEYGSEEEYTQSEGEYTQSEDEAPRGAKRFTRDDSSDEEESEEEETTVSTGKRFKSMTLAEQEELALQLLSQG